MFKIGPRLWKTGLAVAITVFLLRLIFHRYEAFGALAAVLAVAPSSGRSFKAAAQSIAVNVLGGIIGTAAVMMFGPAPIAIGIVVVLVLMLCQVMNWKGLASAAVTATLFVMAQHDEAVYTYAVGRIAAVALGSVVGAAVNMLIFRPDNRKDAFKAIADAGAGLDTFILAVVGRLPAPDSFTKPEVLAGAATVEEAIAEAGRCTALLGDQAFGDRAKQEKETLDRSIRVLASLLERIQIIHKASLAAQKAPVYPEAVTEIQETIREIVTYRQKLFGYLSGPELADEPLAEALLAIERRFESAIDLPRAHDEAEVYFRLYRMRSSVSYMANRLGRLHVKMNQAKSAEFAAVADFAD